MEVGCPHPTRRVSAVISNQSRRFQFPDQACRIAELECGHPFGARSQDVLQQVIHDDCFVRASSDRPERAPEDLGIRLRQLERMREYEPVVFV